MLFTFATHGKPDTRDLFTENCLAAHRSACSCGVRSLSHHIKHKRESACELKYRQQLNKISLFCLTSISVQYNCTVMCSLSITLIYRLSVYLMTLILDQAVGFKDKEVYKFFLRSSISVLHQRSKQQEMQTKKG